MSSNVPSAASVPDTDFHANFLDTKLQVNNEKLEIEILLPVWEPDKSMSY